jgi:hypothetical protein
VCSIYTTKGTAEQVKINHLKVVGNLPDRHSHL